MILLLRYWKIGVAILLAALVAWHFWSDARVRQELQDAKMQIEIQKSAHAALQSEFEKATQDLQELMKARTAADEARAKVQADLAATQKRLKAAQVPKQCDAAVDWLIQERK